MKTLDISKYIIYEDNHIIVCNKPEGILSQEDKTKDPDMVNLLKDYLKEKYQKPGNVYVGLVHRLDKRVSGVMVFAKTSKGASRLSSLVRNHELKKEYLALVSGEVTKPKTLKTNIKKVDTKAISSDDGKEAILEYFPLKKVIINNKPFTFLKIDLITGRFNQIRMQLALDNHPIINDFKYGYQGKKQNDYVPLGLYCVKLSFPHPITKEIQTYYMSKDLFAFNDVMDLEAIYE